MASISPTLEAALRRRGFVTEDRPVSARWQDLPGEGCEAQIDDRRLFLESMKKSHGEAGKLKQQLRAAAESSAAAHERNAQQPDIRGGGIRDSVSSARAMSRFAKLALRPPATDRERDRARDRDSEAPSSARDAPPFLGHLVVPAPTALPDPRPRPARGPDTRPSGERARAEDGLGECNVPPGAAYDLGEPCSPITFSTLAHETASPVPEEESGSPFALGHSEPGLQHGGSLSPSALRDSSMDKSAPLDMTVVRVPEGKSQVVDSSSEETSSGFSDEEEDDGWPPKAPVQRFKTMVQFSGTFKGTQQAQAIVLKSRRDSSDGPLALHQSGRLHDPTVGWINHFFKMNIQTEAQLESGFPVVMLFLLDPVYPNKVPWRMVEWNFQYKSSLARNYRILGQVWSEVNMEKARGFRVGDTSLRFETIADATMTDKLQFLRLTKRWFESRINHSGPYEPTERRKDIVHSCSMRGFTVRFPPWIEFEKEDYEAAALAGSSKTCSDAERQYNNMPEFKRLIYFLGSPEHQNM
eukprot:TRINITY_DN571_c0_g1_i1.p1 TRINITY_DN571_c0_g1~~TRINITY_DN571_c0_g1_i1.p1  ORF type:complete len:525 (+),score=78.54 TRINITY_DN571_c0_g1_i1:64-1638(+)